MSTSNVPLICLAALLGSCLLPSGCKKDGAAGSGGSGGGGGATPVKVVVPWAPSLGGDYDQAVYVTKGNGSTLVLGRGCPTLGCDDVKDDGKGSDKWKASCPEGALLIAFLDSKASLKQGDNDVDIGLMSQKEMNTLIRPAAPPGKLKIAELGADSVSGSLEVKASTMTTAETYAKGSFKAKVCSK